MSTYDFTGAAEWDRIPGWFDLSKAIAVQMAVKQLPPRSTLVELGSFQGRSSVAIAAVLPGESLLYCVDHFQGSAEHERMQLNLACLFEAFNRNIEAFGVKDRIRVLRMSTTQAADHFGPETVDLILLDASHDYEAVKADLAHWHPKLKPGGLLFCDDYEPGWPGVMQAIDASDLEGKLAGRALWLHRKPSRQG